MCLLECLQLRHPKRMDSGGECFQLRLPEQTGSRGKCLQLRHPDRMGLGGERLQLRLPGRSAWSCLLVAVQPAWWSFDVLPTWPMELAPELMLLEILRLFHMRG